MRPKTSEYLRVGDWLLTPQRVALHTATATAVVADLHLGYGESRQLRGDAIPLPAPADVFAPLARAHAVLRYTRLLVAGDLFERVFVPDLYVALVSLLAGLGVEWLGVVPGNHDRALQRHADRVPLWPDGVRLGTWHVIHGDRPAAGKRVLGHWHPCVRVAGRKLPCYLVAREYLVLPAFSRDAAGVDVRRDRRWAGAQRVVIAGERLIGGARGVSTR